MPTPQSIDIAKLGLDLSNYRTTDQPNEVHAIKTLIAINPSWFWPLVESILDDGYNQVENIIVLREGKKLTVKEGNRRIAALKIIHGLVPEIEVKDSIKNRISQLSDEWKRANREVPCIVYEPRESKSIDRIINRIHAKGDKSGRDKWNSVVKARFAREVSGKDEFALDLLEKFLKTNARRIDPEFAEKWTGDFPLSILQESLLRLAPILCLNSGRDLVDKYPRQNRDLINRIVLDIGMSKLNFNMLRRATPFWGQKYGLKPVSKEKAVPKEEKSSRSNSRNSGEGSGSESPPSTPASSPTPALDLKNPKQVHERLKRFVVFGNHRNKLVSLVNEIKRVKLNDAPFAFCFLLRCILELSAKAYCEDHKANNGPKTTYRNGLDKKLVELVEEIVDHMATFDKSMKRKHQPTITELKKKNSPLSIDTFNQLVHHPVYSLTDEEICLLFNHVFPLIEEMNEPSITP